MSKIFEIWHPVEKLWAELKRGREEFAMAKDGGLAIRVVHASGSSKVICNPEKAPKEERESFASWTAEPKAKAKVEAKPEPEAKAKPAKAKAEAKAKPKAKAKAEPKADVFNFTALLES